VIAIKSESVIGIAGIRNKTYIGGKARNMHSEKRAAKITGTGGKDKTAVMGILERGSKATGSRVRTRVVDNTKKKALESEIREHELAGSALFTDCAEIVQRPE
jgi:hypothetical protein